MLDKYQAKIAESKERRRKQAMALIAENDLKKQEEWDKFLKHKMEVKERLQTMKQAKQSQQSPLLVI